MAITIDCENPKNLVHQYPCLSCLSESELLKLMIVVLNDYIGTLRDSINPYDLPSELSDLMSDSACYGCLSDKQMLQAVVVMFASLTYDDTKNVQDIVDDMHCLICADPKQTKSALLRLLCLLTEENQEQ
jgi:hypothetical protein